MQHCDRKIESSWFFTPDYSALAHTPALKTCMIQNKGIGLIAKIPIPRRNIVCYYPAVVRRVDAFSDFTYALQIRNKKLTVSKTFCADMPSSRDATSYEPIWRNKPVLGHFANEPKLGEEHNCKIEYPIIDSPKVGDCFYVPLVSIKDLKKGDELTVDYGPLYDRGGYKKWSPDFFKSLMYT